MRYLYPDHPKYLFGHKDAVGDESNEWKMKDDERCCYCCCYCRCEECRIGKDHLEKKVGTASEERKRSV